MKAAVNCSRNSKLNSFQPMKFLMHGIWQTSLELAGVRDNKAGCFHNSLEFVTVRGELTSRLQHSSLRDSRQKREPVSLQSLHLVTYRQNAVDVTARNMKHSRATFMTWLSNDKWADITTPRRRTLSEALIELVSVSCNAGQTWYITVRLEQNSDLTRCKRWRCVKHVDSDIELDRFMSSSTVTPRDNHAATSDESCSLSMITSGLRIMFRVPPRP